MQNYYRFKGFRLNSPDFSAFAHEKEVILAEGIEFFILDVQEVVVDKKENEKREWAKPYYGKVLTVVYLLNTFLT